MGRIELYFLLLYTRGAPCMFMLDSSSHVQGLNDLFRCFDQQSRISVWLSRQSHFLPYSRNTRSFPLMR